MQSILEVTDAAFDDIVKMITAAREMARGSGQEAAQMVNH
jgi:hypothetical protein